MKQTKATKPPQALQDHTQVHVESANLPNLQTLLHKPSLARNSIFTTLMFAYNISFLDKEDADYLPLIEVLVAKAMRTSLAVTKIKTVMKRESHFMIFVTVRPENASRAMKSILDREFSEECEAILGKVAKALLSTAESFLLEDVKFWRTFLRFKYFIKLLRATSNYEEKETRKAGKLTEKILNNLVKVQTFPKDEKLSEVAQKFMKDCSKVKKAEPYGYGHHRVNVSDEIQSSHSCLMMQAPSEMTFWQAEVMVKILNRGGKGILWKSIRDQGLAYGATVHFDQVANEFVTFIHDSSDIINVMTTLREKIVSIKSRSVFNFLTILNYAFPLERV